MYFQLNRKYPTSSVRVTDFEASTMSTTLVYFNVLVTGDSSSVAVPEMYQSVQSLFKSGDPGAPALPATRAAFASQGLDVSVFYQDQLA